MLNLLAKEIKLAMHPTSIIFLALSAMLLIPNYPYYVVFFYTGLAVFFTCLNGRENHDVFFSMTLPIKKTDIVKARYFLVIILQFAQMLIAIPFAILRQSFTKIPPNQVGMDANITLFGLAFILLAIFNLVFFDIYYKNVDKVGKAFSVSSVFVFLYICVVETLAHAVPFVRDCLDTKDTEYVGYKLIVLAAGFVIYVLATFVSYKKSVKSFEKLDL